MTDSTSQSVRALAALLRGQPTPVSPDWEEILPLARQRGAAPLLYWQLKKRNGSENNVPAGTWEMLRDEFYSATAQSLVRDTELVAVLQALEQAEIPTILLKGAAVAHTVYPDPALRSMADVDLFINQRDIDRLAEVLRSRGYQHKPEPPQQVGPFNTEFTGNTAFHRTMGLYAMHIEPHWRITSAELYMKTTAVENQALWARAVDLRIGAAKARVFSPEDLLLHVCVHLCIHGFTHAYGYLDILVLAESKQIDWDVFIARTRQSQTAVACYYPLRLAVRDWDAAIPNKVLLALQPGPLRRWLGQRMTNPESLARPSPDFAREHLVWLFVIDRFRDLVGLLFWLFFPGTTWLRERYRLDSGWQAWSWMFKHPFVVLREGLRSLGAMLQL